MVRPLTEQQKREFLERNKGVIDRVIRRRLGKTKRVVHGARAQNVQLPRFLERKATIDFDVFAKNTSKAARNMEKALDKKFRGDFFGVKSGATKKLKVKKVFSKATGESFVDFSIPDRIVPTIAKRGIVYASLKDQVERAKKAIKDPANKFRRAKDLSLIRRVKKFEKLRGRKI